VANYGEKEFFKFVPMLQMALTGIFLVNQKGRKLWLYCLHTILFNFEAIFKLRNLVGKVAKVPEIDFQSNGRAFLAKGEAPYLEMRDDCFPKITHLLCWDKNWQTDKAWLMFLSTPVWALDQIGNRTAKDFFEYFSENLNLTLRRLWLRRPKRDSVDYVNYGEGVQLVQGSELRMPNVMFNAVGSLRANVNFSLLTKFLVLNHVTGAVHIYRVKYLVERKNQPFYPRRQKGIMTETPLCGSERKDTLGYIRGYIKQAYLAQTGKNRPSGSKPYDDISVMAKFWRNFFLQ